MTYRKLFDPGETQPPRQIDAAVPVFADRADGGYVYSEDIVLAANVALATGRPLLVRGPSGSGKSSLARSVAGVLGRRYYEKVVTSRSQAQDLLWEVDTLRRLQDAQIGQLADNFARYTSPGIFWWAFDRRSARNQAARSVAAEIAASELGEGGDDIEAVVLLDEIDKADPDVPNNLLVPLGSLRFNVEPLGIEVAAVRAPLVIITTNEERDLPVAFLRRCVELKLAAPDRRALVKIGLAHFAEDHRPLLERLADVITAQVSGQKGGEVSAAEYLDTVRACLELDITPTSPNWEGFWGKLSQVTVWKHGRQPGSRK
jgi:MoxR-like ATPase